jgi:hypothetical protein
MLEISKVVPGPVLRIPPGPLPNFSPHRFLSDWVRFFHCSRRSLFCAAETLG